MILVEYISMLAAAAVMAIVGYWMGTQTVMSECSQGGGHWMVVITHHGKTIECRRESGQ